MSKAMANPCCIDEQCTIDGQNVKERFQANVPSFSEDIKVIGTFTVVMAVLFAGRFALYYYTN